MTSGKSELKKSETSEVQKLGERWGKSTLTALGWTALPNIILERQQELKLDAVDMNILLVLLKHWWDKKDMPYPSKRIIGDIIGRTPSTIQKHLRGMEERGLIEREARYKDIGGQTSNRYNLNGLVKAADELAKQEIQYQKRSEEKTGRKRRGYGEKS